MLKKKKSSCQEYLKARTHLSFFLFFLIPDSLDEYFEYDAEEFLVSLALLITEGRTPECSVKGRTESFHCPPAQSCYPVTSKHECSDKLAQVRIVF